MEHKKAITEGVVLIYTDNEKVPAMMVRGNGVVEYYKLEPMGLADHADWLGAGRVQEMQTHE